MGWPFKKIKQQSGFAMHGLVVQTAKEVLKQKEPDRKKVAAKIVERFFRAGVRVAHEFGIGPQAMTNLLRDVVKDEMGEKAESKVGGGLDANGIDKLMTTASDIATKAWKDALAESHFPPPGHDVLPPIDQLQPKEPPTTS